MCWMQLWEGIYMRRSNGKPEESKTVRQWALLGRIPIEGTPPSYLWTDFDKDDHRYIRAVYYHLDNTREMTEEEQQEFLADKKGYSQRYRDKFMELLGMKKR